jgi:hypothetical protein
MQFLKKTLFHDVDDGSASENMEDDIDVTGEVPALLSRLQGATLLEHKRNALEELRGLLEDRRGGVGAASFGHLISLTDSEQWDRKEVDADLVCAVLEVVELLVTPAANLPAGARDTASYYQTLLVKGLRSAKIEPGLSCLLQLLQRHSDVRLRHTLARVVTVLLMRRTAEVLAQILQQPLAVSSFLDMLSDRREVIRNQGLLLLEALLAGNGQGGGQDRNSSAIQTIVAFAGGFEKLMTIAHAEGSTAGGAIVEDALRIFKLLVDDSSVNRDYLGNMDVNLIPQLVPFLRTPAPESEISQEQRSSQLLVLRLAVDIVDQISLSLSLAAPRDGAHSERQRWDLGGTQRNTQIRLAATLPSLLQLSAQPDSVVSMESRAQCLRIVARVLDNRPDNQSILPAITLHGYAHDLGTGLGPSCSAVTHLTRLMFEADEPERSGAEAVLRAFLRFNPEGQLELAKELRRAWAPDAEPEVGASRNRMRMSFGESWACAAKTVS